MFEFKFVVIVCPSVDDIDLNASDSLRATLKDALTDLGVALGFTVRIQPLSESTLDPLRFVKFYASFKHDGQPYAGGLPYTHHLAAVEAVLRRFGTTDEAMLMAAWLHDVVEDTGTKLKEIEEMFGSEVAQLVAAVTNEEGPNRKVRAALTYPKIRKAGPQAVRLKLADRVANVEIGGKLVSMYRQEHEDFKRALHTTGQNEDMWEHLDTLLWPPLSVI